MYEIAERERQLAPLPSVQASTYRHPLLVGYDSLSPRVGKTPAWDRPPKPHISKTSQECFKHV
eukprot:5634970-Amphidinium_carterae.1